MRIRIARPAFAISLAALLLAACAPVDREAAAPLLEAAPAVWKVADEDTTIYLFGTIHVLPADYQWRNGPIRDAIANADTLVIETVLGSDPTALSGMMMRMGASPGHPPLIERVAPDKRAALSAVITRSGFPSRMLDGMHTWAAALMLVGTTLTHMNLTAGNGVEPQIEASFRARGRPVEGLETPEQQLGFFAGLPEAAQREFLGTLGDEPGKMRSEYDAMLAAWSRGDAKAIAATFDEELKESPELRETLLVRRNANWAKWLQARLEKPGITLVAVGAGHLVGPDSVQAALAKDGVKAVRLK